MKDAQTKPRREECAKGMARRRRTRRILEVAIVAIVIGAVMGARRRERERPANAIIVPTEHSREESALDTVRRKA